MDIIKKIKLQVVEGDINNLPLIDDLTDDEIEELYEFKLSDRNPIKENGSELLIESFYCREARQEELHYVINDEYAVCSYCGRIKDAKGEFEKASSYYDIEKYI